MTVRACKCGGVLNTEEHKQRLQVEEQQLFDV